jgi:hypothetical protein
MKIFDCFHPIQHILTTLQTIQPKKLNQEKRVILMSH